MYFSQGRYCHFSWSSTGNREIVDIGESKHLRIKNRIIVDMWTDKFFSAEWTCNLPETDFWLPIAISTFALLFTMLSFWWMNWRPAKLNVGNIRQFAAGKASEGDHDQNVVIITLPLTMWNSGARPLVIDDLRLTPNDKNELTELLFERVDTPLTTSILERDNKIQSDYFYLPVALKANEIIQANFVFEERNSDFTYESISYHFWLEARFTKKSRWCKIKKITLSFSNLNEIELLNLNELYSTFRYRVENAPK